MGRSILRSSTLFILSVCFGATVFAQDAGGNSNRGESCPGPVYKVREVSRKAKLLRLEEPGYTEEARRHKVQGQVILRAVLCRTGKVVNIEVVKGLPRGLTERALETMPRIRFEPAEKDGELVSQAITRIFTFRIY